MHWRGFQYLCMQASIRLRGPNGETYHHCGAAVISPFHVLTTAHCLWDYRSFHLLCTHHCSLSLGLQVIPPSMYSPLLSVSGTTGHLTLPCTHHCSLSLGLKVISPFLVLTTAHCLWDYRSSPLSMYSPLLTVSGNTGHLLHPCTHHCSLSLGLQVILSFNVLTIAHCLWDYRSSPPSMYSPVLTVSGTAGHLPFPCTHHCSLSLGLRVISAFYVLTIVYCLWDFRSSFSCTHHCSLSLGLQSIPLSMDSPLFTVYETQVVSALHLLTTPYTVFLFIALSPVLGYWSEIKIKAKFFFFIFFSFFLVWTCIL